MNKKKSLIDLLIHDLTGPLSIITTSTNNLIKKEDRYGSLTERQKKTLDIILRNANKAQTFLHDIIEVYRSEEGILKPDTFYIKDVLRDAILDAIEIVNPDFNEELACNNLTEDMKKILTDRGIFIEICGRYEVSPFIHDRKKVQQILRNLITNALKYRKKIVNIRISGNDDIIIAVEDDGTGIPSERQGDVFKRFLYAKELDSGYVGGLGFGLSCVKSIVEALQGSISLMSKEGKGTCFTVTIPPLKSKKASE